MVWQQRCCNRCSVPACHAENRNHRPVCRNRWLGCGTQDFGLIHPVARGFGTVPASSLHNCVAMELKQKLRQTARGNLPGNGFALHIQRLRSGFLLGLPECFFCDALQRLRKRPAALAVLFFHQQANWKIHEDTKSGIQSQKLLAPTWLAHIRPLGHCQYQILFQKIFQAGEHEIQEKRHRPDSWG